MTLDNEKLPNSIFLDFEGEGVIDGVAPMPHLLGVLRPKNSYECVFFKPSWRAPMNGSGGTARIDEFQRTIALLIEEVKKNNGLLIYWSDHERAMIELYAGELIDDFKEVSINLLIPLRTLFNSRGRVLSVDTGKKLNDFLLTVYPNSQPVEEIAPGPAESCRRIDNYCEKLGRWRSWGQPKKDCVKRLLDYNHADCRITWRLAKYYVNATQND